MWRRGRLEDLVQVIHSMDRAGCKDQLLHLERPKLDFTEAFLDAMSTERLRHVLMAACIQARKNAM